MEVNGARRCPELATVGAPKVDESHRTCNVNSSDAHRSSDHVLEKTPHRYYKLTE